MRTWLQFVEIVCEEFKVDKHFALAVAQAESGLAGGPALRFGKLGKGTYYGPFGIHKCFLKRWRINNPYINAWVGIRTLRGVGSDPKRQKIRLKVYNTEFTEQYWRSIKINEKEWRRRLNHKIQDEN